MRRALVKLSGEALGGDSKTIEPATLRYLAGEIAAAARSGVELALVVGGGNIIRGGSARDMGIERVAADYMGMLATVINGMALQSALKSAGLESRLQTALSLEQAAAPYVREKANRHLESGRVMIFAGGTGNPFFTTDTAAALRAAEIGACALLKATRVDGVYSSDPKIEKDAVKYDSLTFDEAISRKLRVMDATAFTLCRDRNLPIVVFNPFQPGALLRVVQGESEGTRVSN